jgi:hypothetical protein
MERDRYLMSRLAAKMRVGACVRRKLGIWADGEQPGSIGLEGCSSDNDRPCGCPASNVGEARREANRRRVEAGEVVRSSDGGPQDVMQDRSTWRYRSTREASARERWMASSPALKLLIQGREIDGSTSKSVSEFSEKEWAVAKEMTTSGSNVGHTYTHVDMAQGQGHNASVEREYQMRQHQLSPLVHRPQLCAWRHAGVYSNKFMNDLASHKRSKL